MSRPLSALAIDLGTGGAKAAVVAADGAILGSGYEPVTTRTGPGDAAEQDAEEVWEAVVAACRRAVAACGEGAASAVGAICCTSQWASVVPVDSGGLPVGPLVLWMDQRGGRLAEALLDEGGFLAWLDINGLLPFPGLSIAHLLHLQHERPDVWAATRAVLEPMDYLAARMTGRLVANANTAMPFALTDNRVLGRFDWSDDLVQRAGVDTSRLPELVSPLSFIEGLSDGPAGELGVPAGTPVVSGANDSVAAAFGTGALAVGRASIIIGTTAVLTAHHRERVVDLEHFLVTMPSVLADRYYVMAEGGMGGRALEAFVQQAGFVEDAVAFERVPGDAYQRATADAARSTPGANGVMYLPWLSGALAPAPDGRHRGAFIGLSLGTTRADLARAVLEGVAAQVAWLRSGVENALGVSYDILRIAGGGALSDLWCQIVADVTQLPIQRVAEPRLANARGAGLMAHLALGTVAVADVARRVRVERGFEPDPALAGLYGERIAVLQDLHGRLAEPVSRLTRGAS